VPTLTDHTGVVEGFVNQDKMVFNPGSSN